MAKLSKAQLRAIHAKQCNQKVSRKIRFLRREGIRQNIAVARGFAHVRKTNPKCGRILIRR